MDLLQFEAQDLYFEQADSDEVQALIQQASKDYSAGEAELPLLQAYLRAPQSLNVLVALNRFYYYQHRLQEALLVAEQALTLIRSALAFPEDWQQLDLPLLQSAPESSRTQIRLYLFTLKSIGFLNMRLEQLELSRSIFQKLVLLDEMDRIGAKGLLDIVEQRMQAQAE